MSIVYSGIHVPLVRAKVYLSREHRPRSTDQHLTRRERELIQHLFLGETNKAMAFALGISPNTVKAYLTRLFGKLGVTSRAEAVIWARSHGFSGYLLGCRPVE